MLASLQAILGQRAYHNPAAQKQAGIPDEYRPANLVKKVGALRYAA